MLRLCGVEHVLSSLMMVQYNHPECHSSGALAASISPVAVVLQYAHWESKWPGNVIQERSARCFTAANQHTLRQPLQLLLQNLGVQRSPAYTVSVQPGENTTKSTGEGDMDPNQVCQRFFVGAVSGANGSCKRKWLHSVPATACWV